MFELDITLNYVPGRFALKFMVSVVCIYDLKNQKQRPAIICQKPQIIIKVFIILKYFYTSSTKSSRRKSQKEKLHRMSNVVLCQN